MTTCEHCSRPIGDGRYPVHLEGRARGLQRCATVDSGLPYGYNAHAAGTRCENPCAGAVDLAWLEPTW